MVIIKEITPALFDGILTYLSSRPEFSQARDSWIRILTYKWKNPQYPYGYVLLANNQIKGLLFTIFSERLINGKIHIFCNLSTWAVDQDYRFHSLKLMLPVIQMKDITITDFSPTSTVVKIYEKLGFKTLDDIVKLVPFVPFNLSTLDLHKFQIVTENHQLLELLNNTHKQLFTDHNISNCRHMLIKTNIDFDNYCYIIYKMIDKFYFKINCFLYNSNCNFFIQHFRQIKSSLFHHTKSFLILFDSRFLPQKMSTYEHSLKRVRLYRSESLLPQQIDSLYSELCLFDFYL